MNVNADWAELVASGFFSEYSYEARRRYQKSAAALSGDRSSWILEVGCGTGRYHRLLTELGYANLVSCDLTLEHIRRAKQINPHGIFVVASGEHLPFKDGLFNTLVSNAAIEHFSNPVRGIQEFARVTDLNARLVITSDCYSWRVMQMLGLYKSKMPIDRTMTYKKFEKIFQIAGLEIVDADAWGVTHYLRKLSSRSAFLSKALQYAMRDDHWSNSKPKSRVALLARMFALDENLFVLCKSGNRHASFASGHPALDLTDLLACPHCSGDITREDSVLVCNRCLKRFLEVDGTPVFP
jgi:SAM-dependent methyltransferase